jgi:type IV secretion system protein VirB10
MAKQNRSSQNYFIPDLTEEEGVGRKKHKNWPRSTRIIWIITIALAAIMVLVLYSLNNSGDVPRFSRPTAPPVTAESVNPASGPYSDPRLLNEFLYGSGNSVSANSIVPSGDVQTGRAAPVAATAGTRPEKKPSIVRKPPSEALLQARQLSAAALAAAPIVSIGDASGGEGLVGEGSAEGNEPEGEPDSLTSLIRSLTGRGDSGSPGTGSAAVAQGGGEDANSTSVAHQNRNEDFVRSNTAGSVPNGEYLSSTRRRPISKYELKAGSIINCVLMGGINSDLPGTILGQISSHVYDTATGAYILIPQGSRMTGTYDSHVVYGQNRILVVWQRIIYPDGTSLNLEGMLGSDQRGYAGFKQKTDNHYSRLIGAAIFASVFVAAGKEATKNDNTNSNNSDNKSTKSIFAEAVMENVTNIATRFIDRNLNVAPTLRILPGFRFIIVTTKDIAFAEPYVLPHGGNR